MDAEIPPGGALTADEYLILIRSLDVTRTTIAGMLAAGLVTSAGQCGAILNTLRVKLIRLYVSAE